MTDPSPASTRRDRGLGVITTRTNSDGTTRLEGSLSLVVGGKRHTRSKRFPDTPRGRQTAEAWLSTTRAEIESGAIDLTAQPAPVDKAAPLTVGGWMVEWLRTRRTMVKAATARSYSDLWRLHLEPRIGAKVLADLTPRTLTAVYADLIESGVTASTTHACHRVIRAALTSARRGGLIPANPATDADLPKRTRYVAKVWTADQARDFLRHSAESDRLAPLWRLMLATGCRRGEALGITWDDLTLTPGAGQAKIHRSLSEVGGVVTRTTPKSDNSFRTVPLDDGTVAALLDWRDRLTVESALAPTWADDPEVFVNEIGGHLIPDRVSKLWGRACRAAGVPKIRLHDARHSAATLWLGNGVDIKTVSGLLGHSSVSITGDVYGHLMPESTRSASNLIGGLLD